MRADPAGEPAREPLGSAAEEAARLAEALHGWWTDRGAQGAPSTGRPADGPGDGDAAGEPEPAASASTCRYCPLCRGVAAVHALRPEVLTHLVAAAESVAAALRELAQDGGATARPHAEPAPGRSPGRRSVRIPVDDTVGDTVGPVGVDTESQEGH